jgi:oxygen-independent coproporphyrinogen-3 oxidase
MVPKYFEALQKEIGIYREELKGYVINTIFIGGGTPSIVDSSYIIDTLELCRKCFSISETCEISIESNPGTVTAQKLRAYRNCGINRISIGLQAYQQHLLTYLGRRHTPIDFVKSVEMAQEAGLSNINADIIFGIPGQTMSDWEETLKTIIALNVSHISAYSLKIEEGTRFGTMLKNGELLPVEDELDREMYHYAVDYLKKNGFIHYELSNFAKPGHECRHNIIYWKCGSYLGIGAGAHSYLNSNRFSNEYSINEYINCLMNQKKPVNESIPVDSDDKMGEYMFLGLRLIEGVNNKEFTRIFGRDMFKEYNSSFKMLEQKGLIKIEGDNVRLTGLGLELANQVFMEFV